MYFAWKYDTIESERRLIAVDWENIPKIDAHIHLMLEKLCYFADVDIRNSLDETLRALDAALSQDAFIGIKLHSSNAGYPADGRYYEGIFEYANAKNALIEIHSYPRTRLPDDVCSPIRIQNLLKKYPKVGCRSCIWAECSLKRCMD